jgi:hypothetical protein
MRYEIISADCYVDLIVAGFVQVQCDEKISPVCDR